MAIKKSIRLSDETENLCKNLNQFSEVNWSGSINSITSRYNIFVSELLPELSDNEKKAIYCAYNGRFFNKDIMLEISAFDYTISTAIDCDTQVSDFIGAENLTNFYEKCKKFTVCERLAIIDMIQRFWSNDVL